MAGSERGNHPDRLISRRTALHFGGGATVGGLSAYALWRLGLSSEGAHQKPPIQDQIPNTMAQELEYHTHGVDRMQRELQNFYSHSTAQLKSSPLSLISLSGRQQEVLTALTEKQKNGRPLTPDEKNTIVEFGDLAYEAAYMQDRMKVYGDLSFVGAVATESGINVNFWQIPGDEGRTFTVDPKAVDGYLQWMIAAMNRYQQIPATGEGDNLLNLQRIEELQDGETFWRENGYTINVLVNTDTGECFDGEQAGVLTQQSCKQKLERTGGYQTVDDPNMLVAATYIRSISTRPTQNDPEYLHRVGFISEHGEASNIILFHEIAHALAEIAGLNWKENKSNFEHMQVVHPFHNAFVGYFENAQNAGLSVPMPLTFSNT